MKNCLRFYFLLLSIIFTVLSADKSFAQKKFDWHVNFGVGMTDMRDFNHTLTDLQYGWGNPGDGNPYIDYRLESKPDYLISAGMGLSGSFGQDGLLGWDAGLNIRTGGFRFTANVRESEGELDDFVLGLLPEFDKTQSFRYWGLHVPLSLNYIPFEIIGFTIGGDLYYQLSSTPTDTELPHGPLGPAMGFSSVYTPRYQHPFQFGAHVGVYAPIGEKLRLDLQFITDLSPRLTVDRRSYDLKFREMGLLLNARYTLDWFFC